VRQSWWRRFKASHAHTQANIVCTAIISVATVAYAIIAGFQLGAIRNTNDLTQKAIQAANTANDLTRSLVKSQQQAVVDLTIPSDPDSISQIAGGLSAQFVNKGKVDATNFSATATFQKIDLPSFKPIGKPQTVTVVQPRIRPLGEGHGGFESVALATFDVSDLGDRDIASVKNQTTTFKMVISYSYGDGFGDTISNTRCFLYLYVPPQPPSNQMWNSWDECTMATNIYRRYLRH
jgi:hypothetical protein